MDVDCRRLSFSHRPTCVRDAPTMQNPLHAGESSLFPPKRAFRVGNCTGKVTALSGPVRGGWPLPGRMHRAIRSNQRTVFPHAHGMPPGTSSRCTAGLPPTKPRGWCPGAAFAGHRAWPCAPISSQGRRQRCPACHPSSSNAVLTPHPPAPRRWRGIPGRP